MDSTGGHSENTVDSARAGGSTLLGPQGDISTWFDTADGGGERSQAGFDTSGKRTLDVRYGKLHGPMKGLAAAGGRRRLLASHAGDAVVLIRLAVGIVFASEGIQKFLYAEAQGAGRFAKIGIPAPDVMGPFVGVVETVCGLLILAGLLTRLAAVPLAVDMVVAITSTKLPILLGHGYWLFAHTFAPKAGFWAFLHESRTDLSMLLSASFLAIVGAGRWSADAKLVRTA